MSTPTTPMCSSPRWRSRPTWPGASSRSPCMRTRWSRRAIRSLPSTPSPTASRSPRPKLRSRPRRSTSSSCGSPTPSARPSSIAANETLAIRQAEFDRKQGLADKGLAADATLDDIKLALQQAQTAVTLAESDLANTTAALGGDPRDRDRGSSRGQGGNGGPRHRRAQPRQDHRRRAGAAASSRRSQASTSASSSRPARRSRASSRPTGPGSRPTSRKRRSRRSQIGQPVEIKVDAYPGVSFRGSPRVDRCGDRRGVRSDPGAERDRQLGQGQPAHSRAHLGRGRPRRRSSHRHEHRRRRRYRRIEPRSPARQMSAVSTPSRAVRPCRLRPSSSRTRAC